MEILKEVYDFAASMGALEGYVYERPGLEGDRLNDWVRNLVKQYEELPEEVKRALAPSLDRTVGRAVRSLAARLGDTHDHVRALSGLVQGEPPRSAQDFELEKQEKARRFGGQAR